MNTTFANWAPNASWTPNGTPFAGCNPTYTSGSQSWNTNWPQQFWNQNTPWNQTIGWNQNGWNQPSPFGGQPSSGYGYGPNGWWFGNTTQFGSQFGNQFGNQFGSQTPGFGFNPQWNSTLPTTGWFNSGFVPGFTPWNSATTPWFNNTPWLNSTPSFQQNTGTPVGFNPQFGGVNQWQPFGNWFNTPHSNSFLHNTPFQGSFGSSFGVTPLTNTTYGWNTPAGYQPTQPGFTQSPFAQPNAGGYTPSFVPNYTPSYTPNNGTWNQTAPSYTGTPESYATSGAYPQSPVNCNGRDAA